MTDTLRVPLKDADSLAEGEKKLYEAGAYQILLCRVKGEYFAVENKCSHQEKPLLRGRLRGHQLICPVHGAAFDVRDGSHQCPPAMRAIETFSVVVEDGMVAVELPTQPIKPAVDPFSGPRMVRTR